MGERQISARRLDWLRGEIEEWRAEGLVGDEAAATIAGRYRAGGRQPVIAVAMTLGAVFIAAGVVSLVASNLDELSPLVRFLGVLALWLNATIAAELLAVRRDAAAGRGGPPAAAVGAVRIVAVGAYAATLFQAAQALQVPAYEPALLGWLGAGVLLYAYAAAASGPLLAGVATLVVWFTWSMLAGPGGNVETAVASLLAAAVAATVVAALHEDRWRPEFAEVWRQAGVLLALGAAFAAALPYGDSGVEFRPALRAGLVAVGLLALAGAALGRGISRREIGATVVVLVAAVLLMEWRPDDGREALTAAELARALAGTGGYLLTVVWFAVVGVLRERRYVTNLATAALVVFVTVQSFGVFAPLLSGSALFLALGALLVGAAVLADRGRRKLVEEVSS